MLAELHWRGELSTVNFVRNSELEFGKRQKNTSVAHLRVWLHGGAENAGVGNAGVENAGADSMDGKCRSGKCGSRQHGWKMQE